MISYQVYEYYQYICTQLNGFKQSIEDMLDFADKYELITSNTLQSILGDSRVSNSSDGYHYIVRNAGLVTEFNDIMLEFKRSFRFLPAFQKFGEIKQNINKYLEENEIIDNEILIFLLQLEETFNLYEIYLQSQDDRRKAVIFGQNNIMLKSSFDAIHNFYTNAIKMLSSENVINKPEDNDIITIQLLHIELTYENFINILSSINRIYNNLNILSCSEDNEKLHIMKIESGSLFASLLGKSKNVGAIKLLLKRTIDLLFNKYSFEGKIQRKREISKVLSEDVDLCAKMEDLGFDITSSKEDISKAFAMISADLYYIARGSATFKINDELITMNKFNKQKFIDESNKLLITENTSEDSE